MSELRQDLEHAWRLERAVANAKERLGPVRVRYEAIRKEYETLKEEHDQLLYEYEVQRQQLPPLRRAREEI